MFARIIPCVLLASLALIAAPARAEDAPPDRDAIRQQFQQMREQFMQKMNEQGIDPQQFFGEIRQQMQDGSLDFNGLQKKLADRGLIDEKAMAQLQTNAQAGMLSNIKRQLGVNDAEWATLQPKIQRVIAANADVNSSNPLGGAIGGLFRGGQTSTSDVALKTRELRAAVGNQATTPEELQQRLAALRDARKKAKEELSAAQKDLTEVLTVSQEGTLTLLGLL
jgi:hypothetical protein